MADQIRLGLIGASVTGTWSARSHLPAVQASSDVELTAVCTTKADSAEAARRAWGARLAFDDWRKMVASPEIEAVAVVVRVPSHYQPTKPRSISAFVRSSATSIALGVGICSTFTGPVDTRTFSCSSAETPI